MPDNVQRFGKSDVLVSAGDLAQNALIKIGEVQDMIDFSEQTYWHNVPGDRHGGPQGPPIDVQWLGQTINISLDFSRYDPQVVDMIRGHYINQPGYPPPGTNLGQINLSDVGALMLLERAWRVTIRNTYNDIDGAPVATGLNFPCCIVRTPIGHNRGSKYTAYSWTFEAHRSPEGHSQEGVLWDTTLTDTIPVPP